MTCTRSDLFSQLMNFLAHNSRLRDLLLVKASNRKALIPTLYFLRGGSPEQKNLNGLLRSLLYRIVSSEPTLKYCLPEEENTLMLSWPSERPRRYLDTILTRALHLYFCLIIDGLDKIAGDVNDQESLIDFVKRKFKVCQFQVHCIQPSRISFGSRIRYLFRPSIASIQHGRCFPLRQESF